MPYQDPERVKGYLANLPQGEAKIAVEQWLETLEELRLAGLNTHDLRVLVERAALDLGILPGRVPKRVAEAGNGSAAPPEWSYPVMATGADFLKGPSSPCAG